MDGSTKVLVSSLSKGESTFFSYWVGEMVREILMFRPRRHQPGAEAL